LSYGVGAVPPKPFAYPPPALHFFVCGNVRASGSPLGPGCGEAGERTFAALKAEVAGRGLHMRVWVTQTACLGVCPRAGCAVAIYPRTQLLADVQPEDAPALLDGALAGIRTP
jgi:(2Fe-2S) ferredoxin